MPVLREMKKPAVAPLHSVKRGTVAHAQVDDRTAAGNGPAHLFQRGHLVKVARISRPGRVERVVLRVEEGDESLLAQGQPEFIHLDPGDEGLRRGFPDKRLVVIGIIANHLKGLLNQIAHLFHVGRGIDDVGHQRARNQIQLTAAHSFGSVAGQDRHRLANFQHLAHAAADAGQLLVLQAVGGVGRGDIHFVHQVQQKGLGQEVIGLDLRLNVPAEGDASHAHSARGRYGPFAVEAHPEVRRRRFPVAVTIHEAQHHVPAPAIQQGRFRIFHGHSADVDARHPHAREDPPLLQMHAGEDQQNDNEHYTREGQRHPRVAQMPQAVAQGHQRLLQALRYLWHIVSGDRRPGRRALPPAALPVAGAAFRPAPARLISFVHCYTLSLSCAGRPGCWLRYT